MQENTTPEISDKSFVRKNASDQKITSKVSSPYNYSQEEMERFRRNDLEKLPVPNYSQKEIQEFRRDCLEGSVSMREFFTKKHRQFFDSSNSQQTQQLTASFCPENKDKPNTDSMNNFSSKENKDFFESLRSQQVQQTTAQSSPTTQDKPNTASMKKFSNEENRGFFECMSSEQIRQQTDLKQLGITSSLEPLDALLNSTESDNTDNIFESLESNPPKTDSPKTKSTLSKEQEKNNLKTKNEKTPLLKDRFFSSLPNSKPNLTDSERTHSRFSFKFW
ncbi:MAG: hypothetical protein ACD_79C01256G0002 [uncultured bacterium]|nr:MAG: hypothetical protein ACD_79C01256G0002 [uncultured bacterium]